MYEIKLSDFTYETHFLEFSPFAMFLDTSSNNIYISDFDNGGVYTFDRFSMLVQSIDFPFGKVYSLEFLWSL